MIPDDEKYCALSGSARMKVSTTWHITDWDQRRTTAVTLDGDHWDENLAIEHFKRLNDSIPTDVLAIHVSDAGDITFMSTEASDDHNYCVHYPPLEALELPQGVQTIRRDELEELDRLGPDIDLVAYPVDRADAKKVVFKYYYHHQHMEQNWIELNICMRLPRHPNMVPFDRVVVDELEGRVIGFTNLYIPGGSLDGDASSRVFKLQWLHQLTEVIDFLNLEHGISHQDVAPRNLVVDAETDAVMLLDFNFAARIDCTGKQPEYALPLVEDRNDVKGLAFALYEIITRDSTLRSKPHDEQDLSEIDHEWTKHPDVKLDHPVGVYQQFLNEWMQRRTARAASASNDVTMKPLEWPRRPPPPVRITGSRGSTVTLREETTEEVRKRGGQILSWQRPSQRLLEPTTRLLATGEFIDA